MRDDEKTIYVNGASEDEESTIYIGKTQSDTVTGQKNESEENTVYIGKTESKGDGEKISVQQDLSETNNYDTNNNEVLKRTIEQEIVEEKSVEPDRSITIQNSDEESVQYYLPTNTMLQKRYRINSVLGEGGFGITYSGWDVTLNIPVAIKEYYPSGLVTRNATFGKTTQVVPVASSKYGAQFRDGIDRVLEEARRMAKFRNTPGIVGIYDFFEANNTAYIVMEYIEGVTLDTYCKENRMDNTTLFNMFVPVMDALQAIHNEGIIHRDISPDNIMVDNDGNFKLLDFGAARGYSEESSTTMSVILKKSYAPEEQFRTKGIQGPWTDVYALGATIYELITGYTPPTSIDRLAEDEITDIKDCAPSLTKGQAEAIMTALAVRQKDRWQSMNEFKLALLNSSGSVTSLSKTEYTKNKDGNNNTNKENNKVDFSSIVNWIKGNTKKSVIAILVILAIVATCTFINSKNNAGPGYFGVYSSDVPQDVKDEYSVGDGTYVTGVIAGTPAAKAGFIASDILLSIDDNSLSGEEDFLNLITRYYAGDKVKIKFLHISKDGQYIEKTKSVKLANKNDQEGFSYTVSSVNNSSTNDGNGDNKKHHDLSVEFVGAEKSSSSSTYLQVYLKFNNPNEDNLNATIKNISLNGVVVSTFANAQGLIGNQDTIFKFQVDHSEVIANQIGDVINSVYVQYYFDGEYNNFRECTNDDFEYSIDSNTFINETKEDITDTSTNESNEKIEENVEEESFTENIENEATSKNAVSSDEIVVSLSEIRENSSYTYLYFLIENNSDADIALTKDWVYLNDTAIIRATSDGKFELNPHEGSVIEYAFDSTNWKAAKGSGIKKLEIGFIINEDPEPTTFEISNTNVSDSVSRLLGSEMNRMKSSATSKNIEVTLSEIKENSSYTYVTFTVKNISNSSIDLGKSWAYINGSAIYRATSDGAHSLAPGKASVIEYAYDSKIVHAAKGDKISLLRLQFYINDADEPELFYFTN